MNKKHTRRNALKLGGVAALSIATFPSILSAKTGSLSEIKKRGYLLYGFNGEKPYNYMDADGTLTGSEIDLARVIAKNIGVEEVQGVAMNFDSFIPAIMAGRIDTCLPIFVKPPRCEKIQYCRSHLIEGQSAVVASGNPKGISGWDDLVNKNVKIASDKLATAAGTKTVDTNIIKLTISKISAKEKNNLLKLESVKNIFKDPRITSEVKDVLFKEDVRVAPETLRNTLTTLNE